MVEQNSNKPMVTISKANDGRHKFQAYVQYQNKNRTVKFGDVQYDDYTIHEDMERLKKYNSRHQKRELKYWDLNSFESLFHPSFWSKYVLWNEFAKPDVKLAIKFIEQKMKIKIKTNF